MRSKLTLLVLLVVVQAAHALDSVPLAEYHQRRVKLAAELHGASAVIFAAHEPPMEYHRLHRTRRSAADHRRWPGDDHTPGNGRPGA